VAGLDPQGLILEAPVLQRESHGIEAAASVRELIETLARDGARLVILGTKLPDAPLVEAVRRIRSLPPTRGTSLLALLPANEPAGLEDALVAAGVNGVLRRPVERSPLESWIAKLLSVPRRVVARIPVQGEVVGSTRTGPAGHFFGLTLNLSVHGMLLASPLKMECGSDLGLEFHLPDGGPRLRVLGRIAREAPEVSWPHLGYGIEFLFVPPDGLDAIVSLVSRAASAPPDGQSLHGTVRHGRWVYEIGRPSRYASGFLVEIRRAPRSEWRAGNAGPFYVIEGASPEAAVSAALAFVHSQE
jgi:CheY-like chemotaxis protein